MSGNNSNRPAIISKDKINFEKEENSAKLPVGPTIPNPGPTLLIQLKEAVKLVVISNPSKERRKVTEKSNNI